ncbi:MAG: hypothetical protein U5R31_15845 [Acidimicrobiia bacterium]|nr:hypothetical protein [Acidimicrobiia bacterium]
MADLEAWCFVCRTHYPHQELDDRDRPLHDHELTWPVGEPPAPG